MEGAVPAEASQPLPLSLEVWERVPPEAQALILALLAANAKLEERVQALEARLGQNSSNSSRPPSADPPQAPRRDRREPSGRRPGGQAGHERHVRPLVEAEQIDHVVDHWPTVCGQCATVLSNQPVGEPVRHQITELPPVRVEVTEHRLQRVCCPACGAETLAGWPAGVTTGAFGPRWQATLSLLAGRFRLSRREIVALSADLFGGRLSVGAIDDLCRATGRALAEPVAALAEVVRQSDRANVDETGWKERGKRSWLWVAVTAVVTLFVIAPTRGRKELVDLLGADYAGYVGSDRYSAYSDRDPARRAVCWAHLRRDFKSLVDYGGRARPIGQVALRLTDRLFHRWHEVRDDPVAWAGFAAEVEPLQAEFRALFEAGTQSEVDKVAGLCRSLLKVWPALWTFTHVPGIEPTNNAAERALRPAVLWRKGSFGTQSPSGSAFVARMLTITVTCRQQGRSLLDYLTAVCSAAQDGQPVPSLLPDGMPAQAA